MTPPPHLLPLALEAMTSADACEVLGDALLESGWCDWRIMDVRSGVAVPASPLDMKAEMKASRAVVEALIRDAPRSPFTGIRLRAIVAVMLFGEWSKERWPLVEAHEADPKRRLFHALRRYSVDGEYGELADILEEMAQLPL